MNSTGYWMPRKWTIQTETARAQRSRQGVGLSVGWFHGRLASTHGPPQRGEFKKGSERSGERHGQSSSGLSACYLKQTCKNRFGQKQFRRRCTSSIDRRPAVMGWHPKICMPWISWVGTIRIPECSYLVVLQAPTNNCLIDIARKSIVVDRTHCTIRSDRSKIHQLRQPEHHCDC